MGGRVECVGFRYVFDSLAKLEFAIHRFVGSNYVFDFVGKVRVRNPRVVDVL